MHSKSHTRKICLAFHYTIMMSISIKANSVQLHHNNGLKNKNKIILITMTFMFPRATQAKPMCLSITSLWCLSPSKVLVYLWNSLTCLPFYLKLKILHTFMKMFRGCLDFMFSLTHHSNMVGPTHEKFVWICFQFLFPSLKL